MTDRGKEEPTRTRATAERRSLPNTVQRNVGLPGAKTQALWDKLSSDRASGEVTSRFNRRLAVTQQAEIGPRPADQAGKRSSRRELAFKSSQIDVTYCFSTLQRT